MFDWMRQIGQSLLQTTQSDACLLNNVEAMLKLFNQ